MDPDPIPTPGIDANLNGVYDLFAGIAIQIVGPKAPVASENFRLVATPAVIIPLPAVDYEQQAADAMAAFLAGDDFSMTVQDADKHAFGFGGRLSGDWVVSKMLYLNLCGEYKKFLDRKDVLQPDGSTKLDVAYGYELKGEFEPHFVYDLGNNSNLSASLPVTYVMWPETVYSNPLANTPEGYSLTLSPTVGYFFFAGPLPMELSANYAFPVMGKNTQAMNSATLQIKTFLKF